MEYYVEPTAQTPCCDWSEATTKNAKGAKKGRRELRVIPKIERERFVNQSLFACLAFFVVTKRLEELALIRWPGRKELRKTRKARKWKKNRSSLRKRVTESSAHVSRCTRKKAMDSWKPCTRSAGHRVQRAAGALCGEASDSTWVQGAASQARV